MLLIKNAEVYSPSYLGKQDVLVCGGKIEYVSSHIRDLDMPCKVIHADGQILTPGFIDQHVHVTGGGGEGSFHTRTPELQLSELIESGITTVIGLLGTDGITRTPEDLYAKISALNEEGVTAYMLTGAYGYPSPTLTGSPQRDIMFIREVLGLKLAISDHRAPNISMEDFIRIASDVRVAGMLSGKPGIIVLHMGDSDTGLQPIFQALRETSIPAKVFRPTHVNRNPHLLEEGYEFLRAGGYIDYTCRMPGQPSAGECITRARDKGLPISHITCSSDGHGSWSNYAEDGSLLEIGVSGVTGMYHELQSMVQKHHIPLADALSCLTSNVADALGLSPAKGYIREGSDADLLLFTPELNLLSVVAKGSLMMDGGTLIRQGTYEKKF